FPLVEEAKQVHLAPFFLAPFLHHHSFVSFVSFLTVTEMENHPIPIVTVVVFVLAPLFFALAAAPVPGSTPSVMLIYTSLSTPTSLMSRSSAALLPPWAASTRLATKVLSLTTASASLCT